MGVIRDTKDLQNHYLAQITSILSQVFKDKKCRVYLFGSRAVGDYTETSDFDIAVQASWSISRELSIAREMLELHNIPFIVELIDLSGASEKFVRKVREQGILIWNN